MKRFMCLFSVFLLVVSLSGCRQEAQILEPVSFYYVRRELAPEEADSVIVSEVRESALLTSMELLDLYLQGPESGQLSNVFPKGTRVTELAVEEGTLYITLSREMASLSGIELTLACACLGKTCQEYFQVNSLEIQADHALLGGSEKLLWDINGAVYADIPETTGN